MKRSNIVRKKIISILEKKIKSDIGKIEEKEIPCIGKVIMKEKAIAKTRNFFFLYFSNITFYCLTLNKHIVS